MVCGDLTWGLSSSGESIFVQCPSDRVRVYNLRRVEACGLQNSVQDLCYSTVTQMVGIYGPGGSLMQPGCVRGSRCVNSIKPHCNLNVNCILHPQARVPLSTCSQRGYRCVAQSSSNGTSPVNKKSAVDSSYVGDVSDNGNGKGSTQPLEYKVQDRTGDSLDDRILAGEFSDLGSTKDKWTRPLRKALATEPTRLGELYDPLSFFRTDYILVVRLSLEVKVACHGLLLFWSLACSAVDAIVPVY